MDNRTLFVSTKPDKDGDAVKTELTLDLSQLTDRDILDYAVQALVVKWQGNARRKGTIPRKATYQVPKPGVRSQESIEDRIASMSPEDKKALIAKLQAELGK